MTAPNTVQCVGCRLFSLQKHAAMAEQGLGQCALEATSHPGRFRGAHRDHECPDFAAALAPVVEKRVAWLRERREEREEICKWWK